MSVSALKNYIFMMPTVPYTAKLQANKYLHRNQFSKSRKIFPPIFNLC